MRVLNAAQMREADRITIDDIGIGSLILMECAGRQVVATLEERVEDLAESRIAVLCGPGNNGGDGFVVARTLLQAGHDVAVFLVGRAADVSGDARINLDILGRLGHTLVEIGLVPCDTTPLYRNVVAESRRRRRADKRRRKPERADKLP